MAKKATAFNVPPFAATLTVKKTLRFQATGAVSNVSISDSDICNNLVMASSTTAAYPLFSAFKLNRVRIWAPVATLGTSVTASVEFPNNPSVPFSGKPQIFSDTQYGTAKAAFVDVAPPQMTQQSFWSGALQNSWMILNMPQGSILDIMVEYALQNGQTSTGALTVISSSVGQIYSLALDFASPGSKILGPVSYASVA